MTIYLSSRYVKNFKKLKKKKPQITSKIKEKIRIFRLNPTHPSLKLHKLSGKKIDLWSFSIEEDLRTTFTYVEDGILLINIGSHKEVY